MQDKDNIVFKEEFSFDKNVSNVFSDMIKRSIPDYTMMRYLIYNIGKRFIKENETILDIGCSNGEGIKSFVNVFDDKVNYLLLDNSDSMVKQAKQRYKSNRTIKIEKYNIINGIKNIKSVSVVLSILTLQFIDTKYRKQIIKDIYNVLNENGIFIFVEKIKCKNDEMFIEEYYNIKRENGYTEEQIETKREALKNILIPLTEEENKRMLSNSGFKNVECFWRCLNFVGFVCIK